jgi:hypothetical protein
MELSRLKPSKVAAAITCSAAAALSLVGCGGSEERLPVLTALRLERLAEQVAAGSSCGDRLLAGAVASVNRGEVPAALQERLLSDANRIAATCSRSAARVLAERLRP